MTVSVFAISTMKLDTPQTIIYCELVLLVEQKIGYKYGDITMRVILKFCYNMYSKTGLMLYKLQFALQNMTTLLCTTNTPHHMRLPCHVGGDNEIKFPSAARHEIHSTTAFS